MHIIDHESFVAQRSHSVRAHLCFISPRVPSNFFLPIRANSEDLVFAEHCIRSWTLFGLMHFSTRNELLPALSPFPSARHSCALKGWLRNEECPRELCIRATLVFSYLSHHLLRSSSTSRRSLAILRIFVELEMFFSTILAVLNASYYGLRI